VQDFLHRPQISAVSGEVTQWSPLLPLLHFPPEPLQ